MDSPCFIIIGICLEHLAAAEVVAFRICTYSKVGCISVGLERPRARTVVGVGLSYIQSGAHIEFQGLKSMHLIVHRYPSDETHAACIAYVVIQSGQRTRPHKGVRREVLSASVAIVPVAVGGGVVYRSVRVAPIRILGRVEEGRTAYDRAVGVIGICIYPLGIQVYGEMFVKEIRGKAQVHGASVVVRLLERTLLACIGYGSPIWHARLIISINADILVRGKGRAEDQTLPVGVIAFQKPRHLSARRGVGRIYLRIEPA